MVGIGISLFITKELNEVVEAFPNWKIPLVIIFVPEPLTNPKSSDVAAVLAFSNTIIPPVKLKLPFAVTFKEPVLLSPLPAVLKVIFPPEILMPDAIPGGVKVPPAVFSSLPAKLTVPLTT